MQTIQFKVLNTDTQETNVQMQTENTEAGNKAPKYTEYRGVRCRKYRRKRRNKEKDDRFHRTDRSYGCGKCQMGCRFAVKKMCFMNRSVR